VEGSLNLMEALDRWRVLAPADPAPSEAELAVCPSARAAMVYVLDPGRREELLTPLVDALMAAEGVDLVAYRQNGEAVVVGRRGTLRFRPGDQLEDQRGGKWRLEGRRSVLGLRASGERVSSRTYPDALARLWSALECPYAGDVLVSAAPGIEFVDWGGSDHVGGGSHGSLHRDDSHGVLLLCGVETAERRQWALSDVAPLVLQHFGIPLSG
jgi:hypothetical protein